MNIQDLTMIPCPKCGEDYPELRKTKYGYNFCVNCSTVESVVGITTVEGSGDHTYNDIIIMDAAKARRIAAAEAEMKGDKKGLLEILDYEESDRDENAVSQSVKDSITSAQDPDLGDHY